MSGMRCPECNGEVQVIDTEQRRDQDVLAYRRRKCKKCGHRFSTYEVPMDDYNELQTRLGMLDEPDTETADRTFAAFVRSCPLDMHEVKHIRVCQACFRSIRCGHTMLKVLMPDSGERLFCNKCGLVLLKQYRIQIGIMQRSFNAWKEE